jgi:hypothetical protein
MLAIFEGFELFGIDKLTAIFKKDHVVNIA